MSDTLKEISELRKSRLRIPFELIEAAITENDRTPFIIHTEDGDYDNYVIVLEDGDTIEFRKLR